MIMEDHRIMSDANITQLIQAFQTTLLAFIAAYGGWKLAQISKVGEKSHDLGNSFMLEQKRKFAVVTKEKAEITNKDTDLAIAKEAEDAYIAHKKTDDDMRIRYKDTLR